MSESNELLLKGVMRVGTIKTENLMRKEDFKRNSQNEFKIDGMKRECMDSLLVRWLKR